MAHEVGDPDTSVRYNPDSPSGPLVVDVDLTENQSGGSPVEFVHSPVHVGKFLRDVVRRLEVSPATVPGSLSISRAVHPPLHHWNLHRILGLGVFVPVDGQVAVRAEITGEDVTNPPRQGVRGYVQ